MPVWLGQSLLECAQNWVIDGSSMIFTFRINIKIHFSSNRSRSIDPWIFIYTQTYHSNCISYPQVVKNERHHLWLDTDEFSTIRCRSSTDDKSVIDSIDHNNGNRKNRIIALESWGKMSWKRVQWRPHFTIDYRSIDQSIYQSIFIHSVTITPIWLNQSLLKCAQN